MFFRSLAALFAFLSVPASADQSLKIDFTQPPRNVMRGTDLMPYCDVSPDETVTAASDRQRAASASQTLWQAVDQDKVADSPEMNQAKQAIVDMAKLQIRTVLPKINSFVATYNQQGMNTVSAGDVELYVTTHAIVLIKDEKWADYVKATQPGYIGTSDGIKAIYQSEIDVVLTRPEVVNLNNTTTVAHEFVHRLLSKTSPDMSRAWDHALIEGDPSRGFLGWGAATKYGGECTPECEGWLHCTQNYFWRPSDDPYADKLPSDNPVPLQGQSKLLYQEKSKPAPADPVPDSDSEPDSNDEN